MMLWAIAIVWI